MPFEEMGVKVIFQWCDERGILDGLEILSVIVLADVCLESNRENDALVVGEADETFIEGLVVEGREADAVFRILLRSFRLFSFISCPSCSRIRLQGSCSAF